MTDTDDEICGETKGNGETCTFSPKHSDGKCGHHTDTQENEQQGRPTKLTYDRQESIAADIEQGKSINSASRKVGLDPATIYNWLDRGESEYKSDNDNIYSDFYERITRARGNGEDFYFKSIIQIAKEEGDHRFLASLMKQRYPDSWGDTETGVDADTVEVNSEVVEITEDMLR